MPVEVVKVYYKCLVCGYQYENLSEALFCEDKHIEVAKATSVYPYAYGPFKNTAGQKYPLYLDITFTDKETVRYRQGKSIDGLIDVCDKAGGSMSP